MYFLNKGLELGLIFTIYSAMFQVGKLSVIWTELKTYKVSENYRIVTKEGNICKLFKDLKIVRIILIIYSKNCVQTIFIYLYFLLCTYAYISVILCICKMFFVHKKK